MQRAGLGLAVVLALVGAWLWWRSEPARGSVGEADVAGAAEFAIPSAALDAAWGPEAEAGATPASREEAPGTSRAFVRGQLVRAEDGLPLRESKLLLLASEENRVSETLTTDEQGAFTTTRAFPRGELRAWVKAPETKQTLTKHTALFEPGSEATWLVPVPTPVSSKPTVPERVPLAADTDEALVRGRVVDLQGRPCADVVVKFVPERPDCVYERVETDREGVFEIVLEPGPWRISGGTAFAHLSPVRQAFVAGENDLGDLVLEKTSDVGHLAGVVVLPDDEREPSGLVFARELASGRESFARVESAFFDPDGEAAFRFEGLPAGSYEVSVIDAVSFAPEVLRVEVPCEGLRFVAASATGHGYRFEVHGARAPVADFVVLGQVRGGWLAALDDGETDLPAIYDEWIVLAPGFRPARGRFTGDEPVVELDRKGIEYRLLRVELAPGHGQAAVCLDVEGDGAPFGEYFGLGGAPLSGVEAIVEGQVLGRSDPSGLLLIESDRKPARLEFARPGWRLLDTRGEEGLLLALFARQSP